MPLPGDANGIAELDVSSDGSHILLGQKVSEDAEGNVYWHLYMDVDDSIKSIDLTPEVIAEPGGPGFSKGVLFDGMTADGSKVFFTTKDPLSTSANQDNDESADVYEAEVSSSSATLTRVSAGSGGTGDTDSCDPTANSAHEHWNVVGSEKDCGAVAIGGGGGVASATEPSTSSPPSCSMTLQTASQTNPTSTSQFPALPPTSSPPLTPTTRSSSTLSKLRRPAGLLTSRSPRAATSLSSPRSGH